MPETGGNKMKHVKIFFVKLNSFSSYISPVLEFLNSFGDLRVEFLISSSFLKKYVYSPCYSLAVALHCILLTEFHLILPESHPYRK